MRLYDSLISGNGYKARLLLSQLDIDYERVELDIDAAETRTEEFLAMNPNGKIPLLELDDSSFLCESNAIQFYLAEGISFLPADRIGRARVLQWMFFEQYFHEPFIAVVRHWVHLGLEEERRTEIEEKRERGHQTLSIMEDHLAACRYVVADRYTIAGIALYAYTHVAHEGGFDLSPYPAIREWLDRVSA
jgi:glutathione S-transferase